MWDWPLLNTKSVGVHGTWEKEEEGRTKKERRRVPLHYRAMLDGFFSSFELENFCHDAPAYDDGDILHAPTPDGCQGRNPAKK
jgi:hypothetical protein